MSEKAIRVFIVDDHDLIIEGLRSALKDHPDIQVTGHATTGKECLEYFSNNTADVVLMDINLPDSNGLDLTSILIKDHPSLKILGLSTFNQKSYISKMLEKGARGYLLKNASVDEIREAIRQVSKGNIFIGKEAGETLYKPSTTSGNGFPPLTKREKEVLQYIVDGLTAPEIAEKLFVSQLTVESHRKNMMTKLKAKNLAVLVKIAIENNLLTE